MNKTEAYLSEDRKFRYWLLRVWDEKLPIMGSIGINPSTADETVNDATIRKDIGFATRLGFGGILKLNVGAYRTRNPKEWRIAADPFGPENRPEDLYAYLVKFKVYITVAAWGKNIQGFEDRAGALKSILPGLQCFGKNTDGSPRHTLMLPYSTPLERFI